MNDAPRCLFSYDKTQHSIVWSYKIAFLELHKQRAACATHTRVHYDNMDGPVRKVPRRLAQNQSGSHDVLCRNTVTQVHYSSLRINSIDDAFHDPNERVCVAEIGGERYEHRTTHEGEMNLTETKV